MKHKTKEIALKYLDLPFSKFNFFIISIFSILVLFKDQIEKKVLDIFVNGRLDKFETIPVWFIAIILLALALFFARKFLRIFLFSYKFTTIYSIIVVIYSYYRVVNDTFEFYKFSKEGWLSSIAYFDITYLFAAGLVTSLILNQLKKQNIGNEQLVHDIPLNNPEEQSLFPSRRMLVENFSDLILNVHSKVAYAIGIRSPWGTGKTSFLNFLINNLKRKDEKAIFINFQPWYCKTERDIISLFLNTLSDSLKKYHGSLNTEIKKYTKSLLSLDKNDISNIIQKGFDFLSESKDIKKQYETINNCIKSLNRMIYITVDDVDRLMAKEILECLKIIRNTADFKNLIYIVAFDNDYVLSELSKHFNEENNDFLKAEKYLEKIFQLQYTLPPIEKYDLKEHIKNHLIKTIDSSYNIDDFLVQKYYSNPSSISSIHDLYEEDSNELNISEYFKDIRSCNIILNQFHAHNVIIGEETELPELLLVCMLKVLYPNEALALYVNPTKYFNFGELVEFIDLNNVSITKFINQDNNTNEPHFPINDLNSNAAFINLVSSIFFRTNQSHNSASYNNNYRIYYNNSLPKSHIKNNDFIQFISSTSELIKQIDIYTTNDLTKLNNLSYKLSKYTPSTSEEAIIVITGLIYLEEKIKDRTFQQSIFATLKKFMEESVDLLGKIIEENKPIRLSIIGNLISEIKIAYIRKGKNFDYPLIIDIEDGLNLFHELSLKLLDKKINLGHIDDELFDLHFYCYNNTDEGDNFIIDPFANEKLRDFISREENRINYLHNITAQSPYSNNEKSKTFRLFIDQTFTNKRGDYSGFEEFLNATLKNYPNNPELKKLGKYWEAFKRSNYKGFSIEE